MNHRFIWKRRKAMLKRARRLALAHWRNRLEADALDIWFNRHLGQYCAVQSGPMVKPNDKRRMCQRFWNDVFDELISE